MPTCRRAASTSAAVDVAFALIVVVHDRRVLPSVPAASTSAATTGGSPCADRRPRRLPRAVQRATRASSSSCSTDACTRSSASTPTCRGASLALCASSAFPCRCSSCCGHKTGRSSPAVVASYILWFPRTVLRDLHRSTTTSRSSARSSARAALGRRESAGDHHDRGRARRVAVCSAGGGASAAAACVVYAAVHARRASAGGSRSSFQRHRGSRGGSSTRGARPSPASSFASTTGGIVAPDVRRHARARSTRWRSATAYVGIDAGHRVPAAPRLAAPRRSVGRGERLAPGRPRSSPGGPGSRTRAVRSHDPRRIRYQFVGAVFIVLALVPPTPLVGARTAGDHRWLRSRLVVVAVADRAGEPQCDRRAAADALRTSARRPDSELVVANLGPNVVPDSHQFGDRTRQPDRGASTVVRSISTACPQGTKPASPDRALIESGGIGLDAGAEPRPAVHDAEQRRPGPGGRNGARLAPTVRATTSACVGSARAVIVGRWSCRRRSTP